MATPDEFEQPALMAEVCRLMQLAGAQPERAMACFDGLVARYGRLRMGQALSRALALPSGSPPARGVGSPGADAGGCERSFG